MTVIERTNNDRHHWTDSLRARVHASSYALVHFVAQGMLISWQLLHAAFSRVSQHGHEPSSLLQVTESSRVRCLFKKHRKILTEEMRNKRHPIEVSDNASVRAVIRLSSPSQLSIINEVSEFLCVVLSNRL